MTQHKSRRVHVQIVRLQSHEDHVECFYLEALLGTKQIAELLPVATQDQMQPDAKEDTWLPTVG